MKDRHTIFSDLVSIDEDVLTPKCDFTNFKIICNKVWNKKYEFMIIDKSDQFEHNERYIEKDLILVIVR